MWDIRKPTTDCEILFDANSCSYMVAPHTGAAVVGDSFYFMAIAPPSSSIAKLVEVPLYRGFSANTTVFPGDVTKSTFFAAVTCK